MFSYEFCEIIKKTYFEEHLQLAASGYLKVLTTQQSEAPVNGKKLK